jgi:IMP dehydrogenase
MRFDKTPKYSYQDVFIKPGYSSLKSRMDADTTVEFLGLQIKIPVFVSNMDTVCEKEMAIAAYQAGAIGALHRFMSIAENVKQFKAVIDAGAYCFCSLGVKDYKTRIEELYKVGARHFIVDIANAWCHHVEVLMDYINQISFRKEIYIVLGNVGTPEGAIGLQKMGADAVKTLIGSGSICTTKNTTGVNSPTFSCVQETCEHPELSIPVIADGGCKEIGDFAKAIGAGAAMVMSGSFFAGCQETPPVVRVLEEIKRYKEILIHEPNDSTALLLESLEKSIKPNEGIVKYRGMASFGSMKLQSDLLNDPNIMFATPEGKEIEVKVKGSVKEIISNIAGGLRSAMSYTNSRTIKEFQTNVEFGVRHNSSIYS